MRFLRPTSFARCPVRLREGADSARSRTVGTASGHALPGPESRSLAAPTDAVAKTREYGKSDGRLSCLTKFQCLTKPHHAGGLSRLEGHPLALVPSFRSPFPGRERSARSGESDPVANHPASRAAWAGKTGSMPRHGMQRPYNAENRYHTVSDPRALSSRGLGPSFDASHNLRRSLSDKGSDRDRRSRNQGIVLLFSNISDPCRGIWHDV